MSCNCKNGQSIDSMLENGGQTKNSVTQTVIKYALKILGFLILIAALPIINIYIVWLIFNMLILNKNIDVKPILLSLGKKFKQKDDDDDDDDDDYEDYKELTEDDVVLLDVEDITNK
jgi:hypothetical protein